MDENILRPRDLFTSLKRPGRLFGFDVGIKSVGLAVSNEQYTLAAPYGYETQDICLLLDNFYRKTSHIWVFVSSYFTYQ